MNDLHRIECLDRLLGDLEEHRQEAMTAQNVQLVQCLGRLMDHYASERDRLLTIKPHQYEVTTW